MQMDFLLLCFPFSLFLLFILVKSVKKFIASKPMPTPPSILMPTPRSIFHESGEDEEDEGELPSERMSIEPIHDFPISNGSGVMLTVTHKTEIGEGRRISQIPEEEAICRICCKLFGEDISAPLIACGCDSFLVHEECNLEKHKFRAYDKCDECDQVFEHTTVVLSRDRQINNIEKPSSNKRFGSRISNLFRRR